MILSWNWLKEYVRLQMSVETLTERVMMAGLNLEEFKDVGGDIAIDLEVTSNRPDCLGHIGVAREVSVLFGEPLQIPPAHPATAKTSVGSVAKVEIDCPDLCPEYTARVVKGVKIGPSPAWLANRLTTLGIRPINNVVDVTNYVMMECGQPLHAFDFAKLRGSKIIVRRAKAGEKIMAIDQREYELTPEMCVIADAERPVAIAGVMGGLETEISNETKDVLIEVADFASMSVRKTARQLNLHSPSSYRFERGVDRHQLDWASRRCAELILQTAGGELLEGSVAVQKQPLPTRTPITIRFAQIERILGISIPRERALKILTDLGLTEQGTATATSAKYIPPTWRRDLTREIDLIEEVARIHGYEHIPENVPIPLTVSAKTLRDRVKDRVEQVLAASGFFEAITLSFVSEEQAELIRPWGDKPLLKVEHSSRRKENILRQTLVPSLLTARRENERHGHFDARLFEIARGFLGADQKPESEPVLIGMVTEQTFGELKGVLESIADAVNHTLTLDVEPSDAAHFRPGCGCSLKLNGKIWGWMGVLSDEVRQGADLKEGVSAAEVSLALLEELADLFPISAPLATFPGVERDLNFVLDEAISWGELSTLVEKTAGQLLESVSFGGQYRGQQIPADKKSYVIKLNYRSPERTLTTEEIDQIQQKVITACTGTLGATLR
ncbi:MAG: phenylalanine--tRNA ligase subunit beta [Planctomycetales bacterium]